MERTNAYRLLLSQGWLFISRYMFNDPDENLPDWFVKEEQYHMRKVPQVDPQAVEYYKNKQNDIGVKTIKNVVEAKARKKRKIAKKMEKAKKKAATILENEDLGTREKAKEIQRMYKKAQVRPLTHFFYCFPHVQNQDP